MDQLHLTDLDIDHQLLDLPGRSLLVFTSEGCAACRWAYQRLPQMDLPVERLCWIDAGRNGGAVTRYEVFHLPSLFVVHDGRFHGSIASSLNPEPLGRAIALALQREPDELP